MDNQFKKYSTNNEIDEKLKSFLLLSVNQEKDYAISTSSNNKKGYKVYLISDYLEKFNFSKIKELLNENHLELYDYIKKLNKEEYPLLSSTQINEIILKLDIKKLKTLNEYIKNIPKIEASRGWDPITKYIKISKNKKLKIYSEFIISPENTFHELKKNFCIKDKIDTVYYFNNGNDIIYKDNILFYGEIDKTSNKYDIKYIFEFESESQLINEITEIKKDIEIYIWKNTALIDNFIDDKISPIFSGNKTIETVYKYNLNVCDYNNCFDYSKFIKNEKLCAFISLYNYFNKFQHNLYKSYNTTEKYYLLKDSAIKEIKNICDYDKLKQILVGKINLDMWDRDYFLDKKEILKIIKNIPKNILETYFSQNNMIKKISKEGIEPENIFIINQNVSDYANIYDNFGIIDKKLAESFIEGIGSDSNSDLNVFNCTLINGRIIIEYNKNLENSKYSCVIGSVEPNNFIINNEYALIFNNYCEYIPQIASIKNKLNKFLVELQLFNGTQPIVDTNYKELGTLIEIEQLGGKQNPNIPQIALYEQDQNLIPSKSKFKPDNGNEYNFNSNINVPSVDNINNIYTSNFINNQIEVPKFNSEDIKKYIDQIERLKKQLSEEKEINNKLQIENKKLEKTINSLKQENIDFKKKLEKEISKLKENMKQLENELNNKNIEIQNYILEINNLKENKNQITTIKPGEKIFFSIIYDSRK